jgi:hypothetical protein
MSRLLQDSLAFHAILKLLSVVGAVGSTVSACLFWSTLTAARIEAEPQQVLAEARHHLSAALQAHAAAAEAAIAIDRLGAAWLRRLTGFPAEPEPQAVVVLGRTQAAIRQRWAEIAASAAALGAGRPEAGAAGSLAAQLVQDTVRSLARSLREAVIEPLRPPGAPPAPETDSRAARVLAGLEELRGVTDRARVDLNGLLLRTVWWTVLTDGAAAVALTFLAASVVAIVRTPVDRASATRVSLAPARRGALPGLFGPGPDPTVIAALVQAHVPRPVARDIAAWLARAGDRPGSLRGHDHEAGGLTRHAVATARRMSALTSRPDAVAVDTPCRATSGEQCPQWGRPHTHPRHRPATARERALAATLAASHDLGKVVTYREDDWGVWTGHAAVPHDSLSAQVLALLPSLRGVFSPADVEDVLLAAHAEHAPDLVPDNCRPLVRHLITWLTAADAQAAAAAAPATEATHA